MSRLRCFYLLAAVGLVLLVAGSQAVAGVALLAPGDPIIAVDFLPRSTSSYPGGESPAKILDGDADTKYLNFARENSGFIVTPSVATTVRSFQITTANDAPERDPASWILYGTNDAIASLDNSLGDAESWTLIGSGDLALPDDRRVLGPVVGFANDVSYTSYRMVYPTLKNAGATNSMQIADVGLFESADGSGGSVLAVGNPILGIDVDPFVSGYPEAESPPKAIDASVDTKYLNFGREGAGFIVTPSAGPATIVTSFQITTANDSESRDPASWELYGTNDAIVSADNSAGDGENWTLIDSGAVDLPIDRKALGPEVAVDNAVGYTSYKLLFPTVRDSSAGDCDSMQITEVQFYGSVVPEPATWAMLSGMALVFLIGRRRRTR
ncbi:MAG: PEP-CTERM sorting domain-containing protein [Pirellulales bacterium]|nr:PEP-CTERM sorting domain-containing protein [Pirellulales bacterium]